MIEMRRTQLSFGDGLIAAEVSDLREGWMKHADVVLSDEAIVAAVYEALANRHPKSRCRGRRGAPAEMVLRLLILKHIRNWSYEVLEREVRANLVYRDFTRVGAGKAPDAKTMGRWGVALGPEVLKQVHERLVQIARDQGVTAGRRMRVDTTVVETDIHHPTDSTLLGDGVRVLTRTMRKITKIVGAAGTKLRDRSRSVKLRLLEIGRVARAKGSVNQDKLKQRYGRLLDATSRVVGQAKRFSEEIERGVKHSKDILQQLVLEGLRQELDQMALRVRQVMRQTRARIFRGNTRSEGKLLSLFEPSTEVIRKGKAGKPNEFGKMVKWPRTRSLPITKSILSGPMTRTCWSPRSRHIKRCSAARRVWWQRMPHSTRSGMRRPRRRKASSASAFPIARPRAPSASASRGSAGSATVRNGAPGLKDASAWSSGATASLDAATRATLG